VQTGSEAPAPSATAKKGPVLNTEMSLWLISFIGLFVELMVIRWLSTEVRLFAYFKNLPLMACFFGLGLGFMSVNKKQDFFRWVPLLILYLSGFLMVAVGLRITHLSLFPVDKTLMLFGSIEPWTVLLFLKALTALLVLFALIIMLFVGFGQETGRYFAKLSPLRAYSINVFGSLVGVITFSLLSYWGSSPGIWLIVIGGALLINYRRLDCISIICLGLVYSLFLGTFMAKLGYGDMYLTSRWSPYYRIDVLDAKGPSGDVLTHDLFINYDGFQSMLDCRDTTIGKQPASFQKALKTLRNFYELPFLVYGKPANRVLILGSGSGTDVAAALRLGAKHIDAVEIDPGIVKLGRQMHPELPYASDRVSVHVEDARTFLKNSKDLYDIIVLPSLDSHTAFSAMSSLRTDNYIFTLQSMQEAAKLLAPQGIMCTRFVAIPGWLWERHYDLIRQSCADKPIGFEKVDELTYGFIVSGPGIKGRTAKDFGLDSTWKEHSPDPLVDVPTTTDDWPFLFLPHRDIPYTYVVPILAAFLGVLFLAMKQMKSGKMDSFNLAMFWLGAGFMLLEVRSMAALSLLFGSTWLVNSVVIGAVMICILLANLLVSRINNKKLAPILVGLLMVAIAVSMLVDPNSLASLGPQTGSAIGCVVFLAPLIFSSATFSLLFKDSKTATQALAFNLVGGVIGVCLEYSSMITGIHALGYVALAIYLIVLALVLKSLKIKEIAATEP
jgi:SAM-dependent methyltransferase